MVLNSGIDEKSSVGCQDTVLNFSRSKARIVFMVVGFQAVRN